MGHQMEGVKVHVKANFSSKARFLHLPGTLFTGKVWGCFLKFRSGNKNILFGSAFELMLAASILLEGIGSPLHHRGKNLFRHC